MCELYAVHSNICSSVISLGTGVAQCSELATGWTGSGFGIPVVPGGLPCL